VHASAFGKLFHKPIAPKQMEELKWLAAHCSQVYAKCKLTMKCHGLKVYQEFYG
jgi:hypothetical protein